MRAVGPVARIMFMTRTTRAVLAPTAAVAAPVAPAYRATNYEHKFVVDPTLHHAPSQFLNDRNSALTVLTKDHEITTLAVDHQMRYVQNLSHPLAAVSLGLDP